MKPVVCCTVVWTVCLQRAHNTEQTHSGHTVSTVVRTVCLQRAHNTEQTHSGHTVSPVVWTVCLQRAHNTEQTHSQHSGADCVSRELITLNKHTVDTQSAQWCGLCVFHPTSREMELMFRQLLCCYDFGFSAWSTVSVDSVSSC